MGPDEISRHLLAAVVHGCAFVALLVAAAAESDDGLAAYQDLFWYAGPALTTRRWYASCSPTCSDASFLVAPLRGSTRVVGPFGAGLPGVASIYVLWSTVVHAVVWYFVESRPDREHLLRYAKWVDYTVTAPVMMAVIALLFGSTSSTAVIFVPLGMAMLLVVAGAIEPPTTPTAVSYRRLAVFAALCVLFVVLWVPIFKAADAATDKSAERDITASVRAVSGPAEWIGTFCAVIFIAFLSFAVVYACTFGERPAAGTFWSRVWIPPNRRDLFYVYLSMVSKTTLHLFLGLTIIGQRSMLTSTSFREAPLTGNETLAAGLGGTVVIVAVLGWLTFRFRVPKQQRRVRSQ